MAHLAGFVSPSCRSYGETGWSYARRHRVYTGTAGADSHLDQLANLSVTKAILNRNFHFEKKKCIKFRTLLILVSFSSFLFEALHDIMKINALLPTVQKADAPYRGPGMGGDMHIKQVGNK